MINYVIIRSSHRRYSVKKVFLKILQNLQANACVRVSFFIKLLAQVFFCEFCEIIMSTFSYRLPLVVASELSWISDSLRKFCFSSFISNFKQVSLDNCKNFKTLILKHQTKWVSSAGRTTHPEVFFKEVFLTFLGFLQEHTCSRVCFFK